VSYADHARRFLSAHHQGAATAGTDREESDGSEERGDIGGPGGARAVWWRDVADATAPIVWIPPRECCGPVACARLGPCDRLAAGRPCRTAQAAGDAP